MDASPIALFAYKRLDHLRRTVSALALNPGAERAELIVFSDAAASPAVADDVRRVREFAHAITGFRSVEVIERERNLGLAASISGGVQQMMERFGQAIIVEDDLVTSPCFLAFMNDGLERYRDDPRVASIHGYVYPTREPLPPSFFLRGADCWGWATWRRAWAHYRADGAALLSELRSRGLEDAFNFHGGYDYIGMLEDQIAGRNDSWAVRWHASAFLADLLTLYPGRTLVRNIGLDGSGTHCGAHAADETELAERAPAPPAAVEHHAGAAATIARHLRRASRPPSLVARALRRIARLMA